LAHQPSRNPGKLHDNPPPSAVTEIPSPPRALEGLGKPHLDWGNAPDTMAFRGRTDQLTQLQEWIVQDHCRLLLLSGMGGIGKTLCAIRLGQAVKGHFKGVIWRSLKYAPSLANLHYDLHNFFLDSEAALDPEQANSGQPPLNGTIPVPTPHSNRVQVMELMTQLRTHPWLVILDDGDTLLQRGKLAGHYRPGSEAYAEFFRRVGTEKHRSCVVLVGREHPSALTAQAGPKLPIRILKLRGLAHQDASQLLDSYGLNPTAPGTTQLIHLYRGNPSALRLAANVIREVFGNDIPQFMSQSTVMLGDPLSEILNQQFERLSELEQGLVYWLALIDEPISLAQLQANLRFFDASASQIVSALQSLQQRSLLDHTAHTPNQESTFSLQPVVIKYALRRFIDQVCEDVLKLVEIRSIRHLDLLKTHALVNQGNPNQPQQHRLILEPILDQLDTRTGNVVAFGVQLTTLHAKLQPLPTHRIGHAAENLHQLIQRIAEDSL